MSELLKVQDLYRKNILNGISFSMKKGEITAVMGPSGSGKSTLLYNVSGMDQADSGKVWINNTEIVGLSEDEKAHLRLMKMGFVFQQMNVLKNLNIRDNIMLPVNHAYKDKKIRLEHWKLGMKLMKDFHISDLSERMVTEVSGGQLQRACICRSMIMEPEILFADEPTGALNQSAAEEVINSFLQINKDGTSILMVTHDSKVASKCERIIYILDGKIKGELALGKYERYLDKERQEKVNKWLNGMEW